MPNLSVLGVQEDKNGSSQPGLHGGSSTQTPSSGPWVNSQFHMPIRTQEDVSTPDTNIDHGILISETKLDGL